LYFSQNRRGAIKTKNPSILNTEVSRILGDIWRRASEEEKKKYRDHEEKQRAKYKHAMKLWRDEEAARNDLAKKAQDKRTEILIQQRREHQEVQHALKNASRHARLNALPTDPLNYPKLSYAYETNYAHQNGRDKHVLNLRSTAFCSLLTTDFSHILTGIPGDNFSVHTHVSHPTTRYNTYDIPPPPTFHDVHPRPYVTHQHEAAAFQCAANQETEQPVHMPFEENLAQGDNRYCSVEPIHTLRLDALKHNSNYAKAVE